MSLRPWQLISGSILWKPNRTDLSSPSTLAVIWETDVPGLSGIRRFGSHAERVAHSRLQDLERLQVCGFWPALCFVLFPHQICTLEDNRSQSSSACQAALGRPHHFLFCLEIQPRLSAQGWGRGWLLPQHTGGAASARVRSASGIKGSRQKFQNVIYSSVSLRSPLLNHL